MAVARSLLVTALVTDAGFLGRLASLLGQIAYQVQQETTGDNLAARKAFAKLVLGSPSAYAARSAQYIARTDNFAGQDIEIAPLGSGFSVTIATVDADATGQIFAKWDELAGLFG